MDVTARFEGSERYRDLGLLGRGGMAEVRRVRDLKMRRTVAMLSLIHISEPTRPY